MQSPKPSKFSFIYFTFLSIFLLSIGTTFASTTITVDRAVHVTTAEGSDLVLDVGDYTLKPAEEWIRIIPNNGKAVDAHLLEAHVGNHEESLANPLALSVTGVEADSHHIVLLLPNGKSFESTGSYSGIRSRGRPARLNIKRLRALAAKARKSNTNKAKKPKRTEFVTPSLGGGGGNRSYNLDCGNRSVLVGVTSKEGSWLDAVGIVCQHVNPTTGALEDEFTRGPVGGSGGQGSSARCNEGNVVQGIHVYAGSVVTYSNKLKIQLLDVSLESINKYGAVSSVVAEEMVLGLIKRLNLQAGISVTGIAGPGGGSKKKPVGLVYIATYAHNNCKSSEHYFPGDRLMVRDQTVTTALNLLLQHLLDHRSNQR